MSTSRRILLEVCIGSADDAEVAVGGGADRLELNAALALGGLTPSLGALLEVKRRVDRPVVAMVRPRPGGFLYTRGEYDTMVRDAETLLDRGADGLALGVLTAGGEVDFERCRRLVRLLTPGHEAVFHRAFDATPDPFAALETLIALGFRRVLTSGQRPSAIEGIDLIAALIRRAAGRIEVLPGAGIKAANVAELVRRTGCDQVHGSFGEAREDSSLSARPWLDLGRSTGTSRAMVADVVGVLSGL